MSQEKLFTPERKITEDGAAWVARDCGKELSPLGRRVANMLEEVFSGIYHIDKAIQRTDWTDQWVITIRVSRDLSTFDSDYLTKLVLAAHDHAIRVEISACNMQCVKIQFHARTREGQIYQRHPAIEQVVEAYRARHPYSQQAKEAA